MHFFHRLPTFNVNSVFMKRCYCCFFISDFLTTFICWYGPLSAEQKYCLQAIVKVCSQIVGTPLIGLNDMYKIGYLGKAKLIMDDPSHPLWCEFILLPSGCRYNLPLCRRKRFKRSFIPADVSLVNATL